MGTKQNSIVLNGKLYDAVTGALIHAPVSSSSSKPKVHKKSGLVMDSVRPPKADKVLKIKPVKKAKPTPHHVEHHPTHARPHKPQRAATLMRSAVSKPAKTVHHKPAAPHHIHDQRTAARLERAKAVPKSHHIKKFDSGHSAQRSVAKKHAHVEVAQEPIAAPPVHHQTHQAAKAPMSASEALVTNAMRHATAHEANKPFAKKPKARHRSPKRHSANVAMAGLAVLILVGFFTYQNVPNLSVRLASTRAGFQAHLPNYQPSGFAQSKLVTYSPGRVTVSFHSNSDDRQFQLTQRVSNWNSQALATNYLSTNNKQFQTYQAGGKTIYIYDTTSATWVNGGVWYQIEGQSSLTSDQLLKIANSI